jgi:V/A-type H+-transporting ATPase subunit I
MQTALEEHGLQEKPIPAYEAGSPRDVYENVVAQRLDLAGRLAVLRQQLRAVGAQNAGRLKDAWADLEIQLKLYEAQQNFGTTWATAVISGWVLARNVERVRATLRQVAGGQCIFQVADPSREDIEHGRVPSYVQHSKLLAPFETLVKAYGVASYTEIEPTLLFTVSFLLMFGIIFGDLGQGLCLAAIGLIVRRRARTKEARDIGWVIVAAGAASMLFGAFLQGSFFGMSLKDAGFRLTLGFEPIRFDGRGQENVFRYLVLAFVLGVVIISLGAILNIVNRLRAGDYAEGLLGRFGLVGIIFYWGALGLAIKQLLVGPGSTDAWLALLLLGLPLLVLALHEPLWALLTGRRPLWQEGAGVGIFQGLIEAMETGTVYVANTFSFLRVAAFALSHAALCFVIFIVQGLVNGLPAGPLWSAAVFVVGTALIIGLEGLIVTIQILRLEYYEFFTKFFDGEGLPYRPFRLR